MAVGMMAMAQGESERAGKWSVEVSRGNLSYINRPGLSLLTDYNQIYTAPSYSLGANYFTNTIFGRSSIGLEYRLSEFYTSNIAYQESVIASNLAINVRGYVPVARNLDLYAGISLAVSMFSTNYSIMGKAQDRVRRFEVIEPGLHAGAMYYATPHIFAGIDAALTNGNVHQDYTLPNSLPKNSSKSMASTQFKIMLGYRF